MHEFQLPRPRQLPWKLPWKLHVSQCKLDGFLTSTDEGLRVYLPLLYPVFEIRGNMRNFDMILKNIIRIIGVY